MPEEIVEDNDGMRIRKLAELRTNTAKEYEEAMLKRVEEFKDTKGDKSGFNNLIQNALISGIGLFLGVKTEVEKTLGEENVKKLHKAIDDILLLVL
jgi:radical SAM superfamily enzyme with C-terminal helix-hairpin-helix motif